MSNIPNFEQWAKMNDYLNSIAVSLGSEVDVSTWAGVQKAVRLGLAPDLFPIGSQLKVNHKVYGEQLYEVVAHDYLKSERDKNTHTMTIMSHNVIAGVQFDSPEAFYYAENDLPAGTYNFTYNGRIYQFTLPRTLPKGGQLCFNDGTSSSPESHTVKVYANQFSTTATDEVAITVGSQGSNLGVIDSIERVLYGSNNYKESAIRQFLNSSATAGNVWTPQTKYDRPPTWVSSLTGFAGGFDDDFLSVVGEVVVPCSANNIYESPDSTTATGEKYSVTDKFYLASQREIFGSDYNTVADDSVMLPYYEGVLSVDRIKYRDSSTAGWWLRSAHIKLAHAGQIVTSVGNLSSEAVANGYGCVPMCTIV